LHGGSLTCWDAFRQLQGEMKNAQESMWATDKTIWDLGEAGGIVNARMDNLRKSFDNMATHYWATITNINNQLGKLNRRSVGTPTGYGMLGMQFGMGQDDLSADMFALRQ
jgi:predicted DNA-binding ArsR family transcriptional regulator